MDGELAMHTIILCVGEVRVLRYSLIQRIHMLHNHKVWDYLMELVYSSGQIRKQFSKRIMSEVQVFPDNFWEAKMLDIHQITHSGIYFTFEGGISALV